MDQYDKNTTSQSPLKRSFCELNWLAIPLLLLSSVTSVSANANCGFTTGQWQLNGANGVARDATYSHPLGTISASFASTMPRGQLWNFPNSAAHLYTGLFNGSDWSIENQSILNFSMISKLNTTVLSLDLSAFPQEQGLVFGLENLAHYTTNPFNYQLVLKDAAGNTLDPTLMTLIGTEKSPNTGGNSLGLYDEQVSMDSSGLLSISVTGQNSMNSLGIFWTDIPSTVATIELQVQGASGYYGDFARIYVGTPDYCPANLKVKTNSNGHSYTINEGETTVTQLAVDNRSNGMQLAWQISGGVDANLFSIDDSGTLAFKQAPDYENPQDGYAADQNAGDNIYAVEVSVVDTISGIETSAAALSVTVADVSPASFSTTAMLRGAYDTSTQRMRDDLRSLGLLPTTSPYPLQLQPAAATSLDPALLTRNDDTAPVDWVLIDFRRPGDLANVVQSRALLLRRDGKVMDPHSGDTTLSVELPSGFYHVSLRHRNHLGVISAEPLYFGGSTPTSIDFSSPDMAVMGSAGRYLDQASNTYLLWAGDADQDQSIVLNGSGADLHAILGAVLLDATNNSGTISHWVIGYRQEDLNLDGRVVFDGTTVDEGQWLAGSNSDHPGNTVFTLDSTLNSALAAY